MERSQILVVDDDNNIRLSVRMCLQAVGYIVRVASNGDGALEEIHRAAPDVVVLDLAMPGMDGMTVLAEIRHLWPRLRSRVIVVTAHGSVRTAIAAVRLGASDFLEKPFLPDELRRSVASVLNDAPLARDNADAGYVEVLRHVRDALRDGEFAVAERDLMKAGTITGEDPAFLNLAGILHESHGRPDCARRFFERAVAREPGSDAARENLRRLDDLKQHGSTKRKVAFDGDDFTDRSFAVCGQKPATSDRRRGR